MQGGARSRGGFMQWDSNDGKDRRASISDNEPLRSTYSYSIGNMSVAAGSNDIAALEYPSSILAGKIIRLRQLQLSGTATANSSYVLSLLKRSTLNSGGTFTTPTPVPRDSRLDAANGVLRLYTVAPTGNGNLVGPFDGGRLTLATSGGTNLDRLIFQYSWLNDMAPTLRNPGECICLSVAGLPTGCTMDISMVWGEEEQL